MPCIWGQHNNSQLLLPIAIIPIINLPPIGGHYSGPQHFANALVDTGATVTGISSNVVSALNMQPIGKVPVHGSGGANLHNGYLFMVGFPMTLPPGITTPNVPPLPPGQQLIQFHVLFQQIRGIEFPAIAGFDVLLGMDVISTGTLVVQGNGHFSFSF
jgi:hypothetical protein